MYAEEIGMHRRMLDTLNKKTDQLEYAHQKEAHRIRFAGIPQLFV